MYDSWVLCSDIEVCSWFFTHMTVGPSLLIDFVGERGENGLLERRRSSGEL